MKRLIIFSFSIIIFQLNSLPLSAMPFNGAVEPNERGKFYTIKPDLRKCASPICGGWYINPVNRKKMRCPDGTKKSECYVGSSKVNIEGLSSDQKTTLNNAMHQSAVLLKAQLNKSVRYSELIINAAWIAVDKNISGLINTQKSEKFYTVSNTGIVCITTPCPTLEASLLSRHRTKTFSHLDLTRINATSANFEQAYKAMDTDDGLLLQGSYISYEPNGLTMQASNFYLKLEAENKISKQCIKTGCSSQLCSDEPVMTTCEYRPEYECYKTATCSRQSNDDCGWEMNNELLDCLNNAATNG